MTPLTSHPCPNPSQVHPLPAILPELFTASSTTAPRLLPQIAPADLEICQWSLTVDADSLTYPVLLTPGCWLKTAQAVARLQQEARWVIDCSKGEGCLPARLATGALIKDLKALQELVK